MPAANVNGVHLHYDRTGSGEPLVLVHSSWVDRHSWDPIVPLLAERFDVVSYDRRGHSDSERPSAQGSVHEDGEDLGALIEALELAPAHVVTNSYGGLVAMRLAVKRPELIRSMSLHEPPGVGLLVEDPDSAPLMQQLGASVAGIRAKLEAGQNEPAARQFVEEIAFGPGAWENEVPVEFRAIMVNNAPTFLDELRDPDGVGVDLDALALLERPLLLTEGDQSPPLFRHVIVRLVAALPEVENKRIAGAAHAPQLTHPDVYADLVGDFADDV